MNPARRRRIQAMLLAGAVAWPLGAAAQQAAQPARGEPAKAEAKSSPKKKEAAKPKADPTAAEDNVEAAVTALGQGRNDAAVKSLTSAISAGTLPPAQTARALYYRGVANRRLAKPAQAIADLTNALWIKNGLTEEQRADALQQRSAAYRDAGLPEQGAPPPGGSGATQAAAKTKAGSSATIFGAVAPQPGSASSSGGSGGGGLGALFGGSSAASAPSAPPAPSPPPAQTATATGASGASTPPPSGLVPRSQPQLPSGFEPVADPPVFYQGPSRSTSVTSRSGPPPQPTAAAKPWDTATEIKTPKAKTVPQPAASKTGAPAVAQAKSPAAGGPVPAAGSVRVQVAAVRSPQEAQGVASKLQAGYARELGGRAPVVDQVPAGNLGTIYRVQVGPFATPREAEPLCAKLKGDGLDCRVLSQ